MSEHRSEAQVARSHEVTATGDYGEWPSPVTAADVATAGSPVDAGCFVAGDPWWSELRPAESGRYVVCRRSPDGERLDVLPTPWNVRTRVHEYGGGSWTVAAGGVLVFAEFSDQRLYRLQPGSTDPVPLTPEPEHAAGLRYGELSVVAGRDGAGEVWCVRETHDGDGGVSRDICAVPLDGSATTDPGRVRSIVSGSHFLAYPRRSPDGRRLAWISWEHPQMPWDGTELRVAELGEDGTCGPHRTLLGSTTESVLQPEWLDDTTLLTSTDRSGWWNLHRIEVAADTRPEPVAPMAAELGAPLWQLGARWFAPLPDGRWLTVRTLGLDTVATLDLATGELADVDLGDLSTLRLLDVDGWRVMLRCGGAGTVPGIRIVDLSKPGETAEVVRLSLDSVPDSGYLPEAQPRVFDGPGGRDVHAFVYPPRNPDVRPPTDRLPPYVAFVHGGPTAHVSPLVSPTVAYFTSRGIGVVDVNYGGSSGYGRDYRERLRGQWGVVDVEDTVAALRGLVGAGLADGERLAIRGGSAGGWTVLSALTTTDDFACGASYFGVAELEEFAAQTHDFESHYDHSLIGARPEADDLYRTRAPLNNVDGLSCPVLLLQGLDDPIVPPAQSELFRDALVAKGIPHAYLAYEGESHGFRRRETVVDSLQAELSFYGQVMGFVPPGVPELTLWRSPAATPPTGTPD